jgi:integrase
MPRVSPDYVPSYRKHKPTGQAVVTLNGRDHYLGRYGTAASKAEYDRLVSEWLAGGRQLSGQDGDLTVNELLLAYMRHADQHYRKPDGQPTRQLELVRLAMRPLKALYGYTKAAEFGPLALKAVRQRLIDQGTMCRSTINEHVAKIKRLFAWGVENELVPASVFHGLQAVRGLQAGRTEAKDHPPVRPVPQAFIGATLPFCPPHVQSMIGLQLVSGMRPGEVCMMRPIDIDMTGKIWVYRPGSDQGQHGTHKTAYLGKEREIYLGPQAQDIIRPLLPLDTRAYIFSPLESERIRHAEQRRNRKSRLSPSQAKRTPRRNPKRSPGDCYDTHSYRRAIKRACQLADNRAHEEHPEIVADEAIIPEWHPNQLRHNAATRLRKEFGVELARIILGHATAFTTEIYAEADRAHAMEVIGKVG